MHKSATKCNETLGKWCKNKHGALKIIDTLETYHPPPESWARLLALLRGVWTVWLAGRFFLALFRALG
jgi:hypothetical protein